MAKESKEDKFSEAETQKPFEAALRGARVAGAKHKTAATPVKMRPAKGRKAK